jgi:hypothetical protein
MERKLWGRGGGTGEWRKWHDWRESHMDSRGVFLPETRGRRAGSGGGRE